MPATISCDLAIVGGGLAGGLIALALRKHRPRHADLRLIEASPQIGGNHLWSFFASDVAAADRWLVAPLISHGWTRYDVAFPGSCAHAAIALLFDRVQPFRARGARAHCPSAPLMLGRKVLAASSNAVVLADGDRVEAKGVIDCRGAGDLAMLELGWQKFLGRELRARRCRTISTRPMVMDATVEQIDGYRFVYCLPFARDADVRRGHLLQRHARYRRRGARRADRRLCRRAGLAGRQASRARKRACCRSRSAGDFEAYWQSGGSKVAKAGMRAGLFHPLTSYSLPDAVRTAALVANASDLSTGRHCTICSTVFARRAVAKRAASTGCSRRCCSAPPSPRERYRDPRTLLSAGRAADRPLLCRANRPDRQGRGC